MQAIIHGRIIVPDSNEHFVTLNDAAIFFDDKIQKIVPMDKLDRRELAETQAEVIDVNGRYVAPGFINDHIHGCLGADTMDDDAQAIPTMQRAQAATGVTAFLPTTMTYDLPHIYKALEHVRKAMGNGIGAEVLGAHMEGPFISVKHKGSQKEELIIPAEFNKISAYKDAIRIITIAPEELHGDYTFVKKCREAGIIVSLGHSDATYEQAKDAFAHGVSHVTHLYNAMTPFHHRKPGIVGATWESPVYAELITDNIHSTPAAQRFAFQLKGEDYLILITDSLRACAMGDGESELGGQKVFVTGHKAVLADGTIAGSVITLNEGMRTFHENTNAPVATVVQLVSRNPARELGLYGERGSLAVGKRADIAVFDDDFVIEQTFVEGRKVFDSEKK